MESGCFMMNAFWQKPFVTILETENSSWPVNIQWSECAALPNQNSVPITIKNITPSMSSRLCSMPLQLGNPFPKKLKQSLTHSRFSFTAKCYKQFQPRDIESMSIYHVQNKTGNASFHFCKMYLRVDFLDVFLFPEKESYFKKYLKLFFFFFQWCKPEPMYFKKEKK